MDDSVRCGINKLVIAGRTMGRRTSQKDSWKAGGEHHRFAATSKDVSLETVTLLLDYGAAANRSTAEAASKCKLGKFDLTLARCNAIRDVPGKCFIRRGNVETVKRFFDEVPSEVTGRYKRGREGRHASTRRRTCSIHQLRIAARFHRFFFLECTCERRQMHSTCSTLCFVCRIE
uniref:Uncharacterized protein n=1 Tax=Lotharella oceanica TaxID=641309 RepID=A0A7S2X941_9EUKA|mmetsp:Transcript_19312/g.36350  ORF Transcript_19312/g.36350 Transcript_19312/m.36350 type:complete len:175 (+) Transcript_19312:246-770(+)